MLGIFSRIFTALIIIIDWTITDLSIRASLTSRLIDVFHQTSSEGDKQTNDVRSWR